MDTAPSRGFVGLMLVFAAETIRVVEYDLGGYPRWVVVLGGTLVLALIIWVMMKLLKWTLWLLLFAVLIGGIAWSAWLLVQSAA